MMWREHHEITSFRFRNNTKKDSITDSLPGFAMKRIAGKETTRDLLRPHVPVREAMPTKS
jgi:hypothetical protein